MLSYIINIITMKNFALFYIGGCAALSWISFTLGQFRLLCFAQAGSMSSLPGFHPSENPLVEPVHLASPFC